MRPASIHVGGLNEDIQKEDLEREFGKFGNLTRVLIARIHPPVCKFAFIEFEDGQDAKEAIKEMNGATINGAEIIVDIARTSISKSILRNKNKMPASVHVGGLSEDIQKEDLKRVFGKFGNLTRVWIARNPPGFAFIEFEDDEDANEAIREMNGATINGAEIIVDISRGRGNAT